MLVRVEWLVVVGSNRANRLKTNKSKHAQSQCVHLHAASKLQGSQAKPHCEATR